MTRVLTAALLGLTLCGSAYAHDERRPAALLEAIVQERDLGLVFDYLREALGAALEGREAPPPYHLRQRADEIGEDMKRRGAAAARGVIDAIEESVRRGLSAPARPALPPSSSSQRI
jgi:hypothetical protein